MYDMIIKIFRKISFVILAFIFKMNQAMFDMMECMTMFMNGGFSFKALPDMEKTSQKNVQVAKKARSKGNEFYNGKKHDKDVHVKTLFYYTKSVAYSVPESEELAKAYGNRSALLFHLKKYKECIVDIDLALKNTKCPKLRAKLFCRKAESLKVVDPTLVKEMFREAKECINSIADEDIDVKEALVRTQMKAAISRPPVSTMIERVPRDLPQIDDSNEVLGVSRKVVLKYDEKKKTRNFVAKQYIKTGEIIIIEPGFAQTPDLYKLYLSCSYCLKLTWNGIPCNSCALAVYCSESCKLEAWYKFHDMECSKMDFALDEAFKGSFETFVLVVRILIKTFKESKTDDFVKYLCDAYKAGENCQDPRTKEFNSDGKLDCNDVKTVLAMDFNKAWKKEEAPLKFKKNVKKLLEVFNEIFGLKANLNEDLKNVFYTLLLSCKSFLYTVDGYECTCCIPEGEHNSANKDSCLFSRGRMQVTLLNLMGHSCHPNVDRNFTKGKAYVFATRPIKKGEKLCFSWNVALFEDKSVRQACIMRDFGEVCDCEACIENWKAYTISDQSKAQEAFKKWIRRTSNPEFYAQVEDKPLRHFEGTADYLKSVHEFVDRTYHQTSRREADIISLHFRYACRSWSSPYYEVGLEIPEDCRN